MRREHQSGRMQWQGEIALVALGQDEAVLGRFIAQKIPGSSLHVHRTVSLPDEHSFDRILELTADIFPKFPGLVFLAPCGVVVRAIAPHVRSKLSDPAVVVVDAGGRHVVSLLSGHEGGANNLCMLVANAIGAEPVITTTSEATKRLIVGLGCRRGTPGKVLIQAIKDALEPLGVTSEDVRLLATADVKRDEPGLWEASNALGIPVRIVSSKEIRSCVFAFSHSDFVQDSVKLPAVAQPAALLAGRRTRCLLPRTVMAPGVVVAVVQEDWPWSALDQVPPRTERTEPSAPSKPPQPS